MRAMEGRTWMRSARKWSAGLVLAMGCASGFAGTPVQGSFRVSVRVPAPPAVATALLDAVPAPAGAQRLTRNIAAGDSYRIDRDADAVSRLWRDAMIAGGYRLMWESADGRMSSWSHARHRVDVDVREVIGANATSRVVVQASPTS
jgi:hypothetical protein